MKYKIGIIGAGAIGCFVGAHLIGDETEVTFLGRERFGHLIKENDLTITEHGGESFTLSKSKINWVTKPSDLPLLDLLIFTTKSHDTKTSALEVQNHVHEKTIILSLQNGLHNSKDLEEVFPKHTVVGGMVAQNIVQVSNRAHFKQSTSGIIYLGENIPYFQKLSPFVTKELRELQLGKLLKNLNNALNALSNRPLLAQLQDKKERLFLAKIVSEALIVMKKNKLNPKNTSLLPISFFPKVLTLPNFLFNFISAREIKSDPLARPSMWLDLELNRKTEIDYLNGEIVLLAKKVGMNVPMNELIVKLIEMAERGDVDSARREYRKLIS
jgi:2-dehydropantoate 2-reductase